MPHLVGWQDLEQTILYLAEKGASTIRVFMPGYTRYTRIELPEADILLKLLEMAADLRERIKTPVIIEPPMLDNLSAVVEGVVGESSADAASIKTGDIIEKVNGKEVFSRVDAYEKLFAAENPRVDLQRKEDQISVTVQKSKNASAGLVFNYDIAFRTAGKIRRIVDKYESKSCLMLTCRLGYRIIRLALKDKSLDIQIAENSYFGGNIMSAGLLVLQDIEAALKQQNKLPKVLFLPQIMFDEKGRDLTGRHYMELEQQYNLILVLL
jgi:NifB/MoaA-like Fe-S oxidoreductase